MSRSLIINGDIVNPPTSPSCFRDVIFYAHEFLDYNVLIEVNSEKDFYYNFLKRLGLMDFIDDILKRGIEEGYRIDTDFYLSPTVYVTKSINAYNVNSILQSIGFRRLSRFTDINNSI